MVLGILWFRRWDWRHGTLLHSQRIAPNPPIRRYRPYFRPIVSSLYRWLNRKSLLQAQVSKAADMPDEKAAIVTGAQQGTGAGLVEGAKVAGNHERLLVAEAKSGRSTAFGELYELHRSKIYHTTFRILRNQQDAEDTVQRSFQRAFTNLASFRGNSTFSTWLTRIAINEALMLLRQRRANKHLFGSDTHDDFEAWTVALADKKPTPEEILSETELRVIVTQAISHLRKNLQIVALLRDLQGLTSAQTAQVLGLSVAAVKARNFHARRCLRRQLERNLRGGRSRRPTDREENRVAVGRSR